MYRHLFGPVPSRRLGMSLGVDMLADKTCSFDCVFCEVGRTRELTLDRKEYVKSGDILRELRSWVGSGGQADYITIAGKGEPTLNTGFGDVIRGIREISETPVAILSNGSLFSLEDVRLDAALADVVKVSLGAWNQESMNRLNRPCSGLNFEKIVEGYAAFRNMFDGEFWLEVLLVDGINSGVDDIALIAETAASFAPDKIQLNTVVRPGADKEMRPVAVEKMESVARLFNPPAEVIVDYKGNSAGKSAASIREILMRRPCTLDDLAEVSGLDKTAILQMLEDHAGSWQAVSRNMGDKTYYLIENGKENEF